MGRLLIFLGFLALLSSCSRSIYVVRHAERDSGSMGTGSTMSNDPALSEAGKVRAFVLRDELVGKHIKHIYSTNTIRTVSTAGPLSTSTGIKIELYNTRDSLNQFLEQIRNMKGNMLVVGHSNTVDDIVNKLCGEKKIAADLKDTEYDNLYILKQKGKKIVFTQRKYGYPSAPEK